MSLPQTTSTNSTQHVKSKDFMHLIHNDFDAGCALQNESILKAVLLQELSARTQRSQRKALMGRWGLVTTKLHDLQSDNSSTECWEHRNGVTSEKTWRGAIANKTTLVDELFDYIRTVANPGRWEAVNSAAVV